MGAFRNITTGVVASVLLATSAAPALADGPHGGYGGGWGHERHDHDGIGAGAIFAGILGLGIIAAVASSSGSSHQDQYQRGDYPNNAPPPPPVSHYNPAQGQGRQILSDTDAVDACANAVAYQSGASSQVRNITDVQGKDNGWDVKGVIALRNGYQGDGDHNFKCKVRYGSIQSVQVESDLAYND